MVNTNAPSGRFFMGDFMKTLYLYAAGLIAAVVMAAWVLGGRVAHEKCVATHAKNAAAAIETITQAQEKINVQTIQTATADIRRVLREKYTIAQ